MSVNWDQTSLINKLRILVGMLFGLVVLEGLRDSIIFFTSISSVRLRKKEFILRWGRKLWTLFFEYLIGDWMSVATFTEYLLKALAISCGSVKHWPLSIILDGATLGNCFKEIRFFLPFHLLFKSFVLFWK